MVKREKARIRVPAFESWFPTCETLSKSLYFSEPHFSHLQTGMMLVPTHRELWAVNEVVYIKYLEQWLKHRIRSLYTSHSCYSLPSLGRCICALTEVLSQARWRPFLPLVLLPFASGLGWGGYRILHSFFLVLQKPLTSRSLPSVFLLFPEVSRETRAGCSHGNDGNILQPMTWQQHQESPLPEVTEASGLGMDNSHAGIYLALSTHRGD